jgi:cytochrome c-type biogenesis protein
MLIAPGWGTTFLGSILLIAAVTGTVWENILRLTVYALGFGIIFMALFLLSEPAMRFFKQKAHIVSRVEKVAGVVVVVIGLLMVSDQLALISGLATWSGKAIIHGFLGVK